MDDLMQGTWHVACWWQREDGEIMVVYLHHGHMFYFRADDHKTMHKETLTQTTIDQLMRLPNLKYEDKTGRRNEVIERMNGMLGIEYEPIVAEKAPAAKEEPKAELPGKVEYDAVKNGMTREQVEQLFEKVDVISESESEVAGYSSLAVSYKADGDLGANIFIIYMDGVVESKSNFGVK